jgi:diguanylate cyclase (GGDEF)-like protein/PAS domain S-box-containing protein
MISKKNYSFWKKIKQTFRQSKVLSASLTVGGVVILLRLIGLLQTWELGAFDYLLKLRPTSKIEERILIVGITEQDIKKLNTWPMSDEQLAELLWKIHSYQPRLIGLDIYRDLYIDPGKEKLIDAFNNIPNIIGIEKLGDDILRIPPPPVLESKSQIGFNDIMLDEDKVIRRNLLLSYPPEYDYQPRPSFGFKSALIYLEQEQINLEIIETKTDELFKIGSVVFPRFQNSDGGYVRTNDSGYQILGYFRPNQSFRQVSMTEMLEGQVDPDWVKDKIVLIGSTAISLKDQFYYPHSKSFLQEPRQIFGVELHANFISQILNAVYDEEPLIQVTPNLIEWLWILVWCFIGADLSWKWRSPLKSFFAISIGGLLIFITAYSSFLLGWWIPLVPPLLGLFGSAGLLTSYLAYQEQELQRSKEFLQSVIDKIPDPIFVKDINYRWIILNEAFSELLGYPVEQLLGKTDDQFFSEAEAKVFREQDQLVLNTFQPQENEESFTNASQITYFTETKRSIHQDRAGNIFLVGVIRDITERKRMEEDLRRTAAELIRSNTELKSTEKKLRYLAYHDPLTGLANRKLFYESLKEYLVWGEENNQLVGLLFIDLDGFKPVNDTLGHDIGDLLLKAVAQRIKNALRSSDIVCRLGGDEFTAILPGIKQSGDGAIVADKILKTLSQAFMINGNSIAISASIGISIYPLDGETDEILIKKADLAMYQAKKSGRNQYQIS